MALEQEAASIYSQFVKSNALAKNLRKIAILANVRTKMCGTNKFKNIDN